MSDIVERLRARQVTNWVHATGQTPRASGKRTDPLCAAAADEIERLRAEVAQLREWLEADARCPCCDTVDACLDDCTFATDCPQDAGRMAEVRALLAARKGEA